MIQIGSTKVLAGVRALIKAKEGTDDAANNATVEGMDLEVSPNFNPWSSLLTLHERNKRILKSTLISVLGRSAADSRLCRVGSDVQRRDATRRCSTSGTGAGERGAEGD